MINSTQQNIPVAGIKEGIIILKNGGYRLILSCAPINFALKSEEEQNSLVFQYQGFLNSLHFPIEIVIQSKRLDLTTYIKKINDLSINQENELIKSQMADYIDFVGRLIEMANIMKKSFYVTVPYDPIKLQKETFLGKIFMNNNKVSHLRVSDQEFSRYKSEIIERANIVASGLGGLGIPCFQLNTEEIIELLYGIYNPDIAGKERVTNPENLTSSFVSSVSSKPENNNMDQNTAKLENKPEENIIDNSGIVERYQKESATITKREEAANPKIKETPPPTEAPVQTPPVTQNDQIPKGNNQTNSNAQ